MPARRCFLTADNADMPRVIDSKAPTTSTPPAAPAGNSAEGRPEALESPENAADQTEAPTASLFEALPEELCTEIIVRTGFSGALAVRETCRTGRTLVDNGFVLRRLIPNCPFQFRTGDPSAAWPAVYRRRQDWMNGQITALPSQGTRSRRKRRFYARQWGLTIGTCTSAGSYGTTTDGKLYEIRPEGSDKLLWTAPNGSDHRILVRPHPRTAQQVVALCPDGSLRGWQPPRSFGRRSTWTLPKTPGETLKKDVAWLPDGSNRFAACDQAGLLRLWQTAPGKAPTPVPMDVIPVCSQTLVGMAARATSIVAWGQQGGIFVWAFPAPAADGSPPESAGHPVKSNDDALASLAAAREDDNTSGPLTGAARKRVAGVRWAQARPHRLVSWSTEADVATMWDAEADSIVPLMTLPHTGLKGAFLSASGSSVVTWSRMLVIQWELEACLKADAVKLETCGSILWRADARTALSNLLEHPEFPDLYVLHGSLNHRSFVQTLDTRSGAVCTLPITTRDANAVQLARLAIHPDGLGLVGIETKSSRLIAFGAPKHRTSA